MRGAGKEFQELLANEFPESYKILRDKKLIENYIIETTQKIKKYKIKIRGLEIH